LELRRQCLLQELRNSGIETCVNGEKLLRTMTLPELETEYSRYKDRDFQIPKVGVKQNAESSGTGRTLDQRSGVEIHP
jgi:hypothetical protein